MKKYLLLLIAFAGINIKVYSQESSADGIKWMSWEKAAELNKTSPKKMFIDVYTDWCGWCKRMDAGTFRDSAVIDYMNKNYYAIKLNAERKDTVIFDNKTFVYKPEYKTHELAIALLNGKLGYPSFIFLDEKYAMLTPLSGYQTVEQLMPALRYYGSDIYKTKTWEEYNK